MVVKLAAVGLVLCSLCGCATAYDNKDILNQSFPRVTGKSLEEEVLQLPDHFSGQHTILLLGYEQNAQFDIDRWLLGLTDSQLQATVYEIPTVVGMFPGMISGRIDDGMRSGIPAELWISVITVYGGDAERLARFTGNEKPLNARVILLDPGGKVVYFHDRGYGIPYLKVLLALIPAPGE